MTAPPLNYSRYLKLDELLALQQPLSDGPEHDETLFIIIHQVYELWFKQLLHELEGLKAAFAAGTHVRALAGIRRILTILKTLVAQVDILETMSPLSFNAFRARLEASSGFQSAQFRAVEFSLGYKRRGVMEQHPQGSEGRLLLERIYSAAPLYDCFLSYLAVQGHSIPAAVTGRDVREIYGGSDEVQALLVELYRRGDFAAQICEHLVDLDEGLQEWRYRHVKMVERTIGAKAGSGGSTGVAYLRSTLFQPLFPDLWAIRAQL